MLGIKKIYLFILKSFGLLFVGTFFICLFVLMMQFLWRNVDELIGKGLTMDVLAQFFYYASLTMIPMALPLAILLASLITFGNFGERYELLAMKAAGIPLIVIFRPLIIFVVIMTGVSLYFQNVIGPKAAVQVRLLLFSMKQKSPELDIPEGVFYNEIQGYNLFVQQKNKKTGMMYGVMIYMNTDSQEDSQIVLADSASLRMTADKKHLQLTLYNGERFRNMQSQKGISTYANAPYMRETFIEEVDLIPFNTDFNMMDASLLSNSAVSKNMEEIQQSIDSLSANYDSIGRQYYADLQVRVYPVRSIASADTVIIESKKEIASTSADTAFTKLSAEKRLEIVRSTQRRMESAISELDYKRMVTADGDKAIRYHWVEWFQKITMSLSCLLFFFIGAPLGAIIRKGGLGLPVVMSVAIYIFYYIIDFSGMKMAKAGEWEVAFGMWLSSLVLFPIAIFLTYKANTDSVMFNFEVYQNFFRKILGLRNKRTLFRKEVIIHDPNYDHCIVQLQEIGAHCTTYQKAMKLKRPPNYWNLFFRYQPDHHMEEISEQVEQTVLELANTKDTHIISALNQLPIMVVKAHTRPFDVAWINVVVGIILPLGLFFYLRMWRFRILVDRDIKQTCTTCKRLEEIINEHYSHKLAQNKA